MKSKLNSMLIGAVAAGVLAAHNARAEAEVSATSEKPAVEAKEAHSCKGQKEGHNCSGKTAEGAAKPKKELKKKKGAGCSGPNGCGQNM